MLKLTLKDTDYRFKGFDTSFLKNLIEFPNFVFNCRFYFVNFNGMKIPVK